jgi:signal transduction histidine kinase
VISKVKRQVTSTADSIGHELDQVQKYVNDLADRMRQLSHQLHPAVLEHAGLEAALKSFVTEFSQLEDIQVKLTLPNDRVTIP